ncbi:MAG: Putative polyhydroxyalkanoic acid system protein (PHA_gran_rgn) [uncultured Thermomicrobiales bacterium]|uniref:Polyhydroxyalkanoic acid system protein (PHA_gran_rgn) n=1 Tax=uncultured Thermomicrobiales bacterium TaxID=1645740 RepID=A0A6J4UYN0_9BACT|nr:MAG: Putative polyhydroxyalkanoic acid system protein (PHA_gran_rgn) [uncultured Thermomicrobiales bacterium]
MPKLAIVVPHELSEEEALGRIKNLLSEMKTRYATSFSDLEERWSGNEGRFSVKAMGFRVAGGVAVRPAEVAIDADLPMAATPFKGRVEQLIRSQAEQLLARR